MKQSVLALSILGLLSSAFMAAYVLLPLQVLQQLPSPLPITSIAAFLEFALPYLAFVVSILGVLYAERGRASRWTIVFVTCTVLAIVLPVIGFCLTFLFAFSYEATLVAVAQITLDIGLLFPILVFSCVLLYVARWPWQGRRDNKTSGRLA